MSVNDRNFDAIANKFEKNIYGTSKGKLRHQLLCRHIAPYLPVQPSRILDAGAGTGVMAEFLTKQGHQLSLLDISSESLAIAKQRSTLGNAEFIHGDLQQLTEHYEFIVCHAVLEWLVEPLSALETLLRQLKPGGKLSLSFFNRDAALFGNLLYGNFAYVKNDLKNKNTVRLNPNNPQQPKKILHWCEEKQLNILHSAGIRCIHDYMKNGHAHVSYDELVEMEYQYGLCEPFKWLGKYFHMVVEKP